MSWHVFALLLALAVARYSGMCTKAERWFVALACWVLALVLGFYAVRPAHAADVPPAAAHAWQRTLTREARAVWGLDAPVPLFGAQIQQESGWRADARSPYADGLAQFTAGTAADMARWYPDLRPVDAYNPAWAMRALVRYNHRLYLGIENTASDCDHWAMTFSAYNGGAGWLARDRAQCARVPGCDPSRWWGQVEGQTQRATWARTENRAYPQRILLQWQPLYATAWGGALVCP
jgi:soluble lytic murein transglycosylase-like protein